MFGVRVLGLKGSTVRCFRFLGASVLGFRVRGDLSGCRVLGNS